MAESEQPILGPRLARLVGAVSKAADHGAGVRLRHAGAAPETRPEPEMPPQMPPTPPLESLATETKLVQPDETPPPRRGRPRPATQAVAGPQTDAPVPKVALVPGERNSDTRESQLPDAPPALPEPEIAGQKPETEKARPRVRHVIERVLHETPGPAPDRAQRPRPSVDPARTQSPPQSPAQPVVRLQPAPPAALPEPVDGIASRPERVLVVDPASPSAIKHTQLQRPSSSAAVPVVSMVPDETDQQNLHEVDHRPEATAPDETTAAAPSPAIAVTTAVPPTTPTPVLATSAEPALNTIPLLRPAASRPVGPESMATPPPPPVRIEIGEVLISVRPPETSAQRPALSVAHRAPRAHAIPLSGWGED